jgi:hypothetical protein
MNSFKDDWYDYDREQRRREYEEGQAVTEYEENETNISETRDESSTKQC